MTPKKYDDYLLSDHWKAVREERLRIDGYQCQFCGCRGTAKNPLMVHHFDYRSVGHENVWHDVVTVCLSCHLGIHKLMQRQTSPDGEHGWCSKLPFSVHVVGDRYTPNPIKIAEDKHAQEQNR